MSDDCLNGQSQIMSIIVAYPPIWGIAGFVDVLYRAPALELAETTFSDNG